MTLVLRNLYENEKTAFIDKMYFETLSLFLTPVLLGPDHRATSIKMG